MEDMIYIKPHHFVDILTSFGTGRVRFEPHPYGHAVHIVAEQILTNRDVTLRIELGADDICRPCEHNIDGLCDDTIDTSFRPGAPSLKRDWNLLIDRRWCERLKIEQGHKLSARELCRRLRDLAGDITDIYREIPARLTADRARKLEEGIRKFPNDQSPYYRARDIFAPGMYGPRCHSSTIVELKNGDLMAAWWSGSYEGATDVVIKAARLPLGADTWEPATTVADFPDRFQGNPVLFSLADGRLWLFFAVIHFRGPKGVQIMFRESTDLGRTWGPMREFATEPGIRTRNHPIIMPNGEILFPLHDQRTGSSVFLISGDLGQTWEMTLPCF